MDHPTATLRVATRDDAAALDALMKGSIAALFPAFYDERQTASGVRWIAEVDEQLIDDGTYFAIDEDGDPDPVACGGWSRRDKLFRGEASQEGRARLLDPATEPARIRAMFVRGDWARRGLGTRILEACEDAARAEGFRELSLMATLPGEQLYLRFGFVPGERTTITLPDGVALACVPMTRPIGPAGDDGSVTKR